MGLDVYLMKNDKMDKVETIEIDSEKYPKHLFKIGYFRSSYNDFGFNSIVGNSISMNLYSIFNTTESTESQREGNLRPDWVLAKENAETAIKLFKEYLKTPYVVSRVSGLAKKAGDDGEALRIFLNELKNNVGNYSSFNGDFYLKSKKIYGILQGEKEQYLILKADLKPYLESLEIILETINYVLRQKDSKSYTLSWSG